MTDSVVQWVHSWRCGDQQAAGKLFRRYAEPLVRMARSRLSARLNSRVDPEEVVQSAYRSFFVRARDGRFEIERGADLWRLLVALMLHKLQHQVRRHRVAKRSVDREQPVPHAAGFDELTARIADRNPSPLEAAALVDEIEELMKRLDPRLRQVLQLRLQGYDLEEIAAAAACSQRTVRRALERIRELLPHD